MEQINVKAKKWGNSIGLILPSAVVERERINEGTELIVNVKTKHKATVGDIIAFSRKYGLAKKLKNIDTKKALREIDEVFGT